MLELMSQEALRLGSERRQEVARETIRDARRAETLRHATGVALVAMGHRVAGNAPTPSRSVAIVASSAKAPKLQTTGDCI
jgi:hypothetical protein